MEITILEEFRNLIPPLSDEEYRQLEANCIADGIREPLSVWTRGKKHILVDGHNRYAIAQDHNLEYKIKKYKFRSKAEATQWIIKNQIGRRNLNKFQRIELVLPLKKELSKAAKDNQRGGQGGLLLTNLSKANTRNQLAVLAGVSEGTLQKAIAVIREANNDLLQELRSGECSITSAYNRVQQKRSRQYSQRRKCDEEAKKRNAQSEGYDVIVIAPPYPEMPIDEIRKMQLPMAKDCCVFLWSTQELLPDSFDMLKSWGLEYHHLYVWDKQISETRGVEFCIFACKRNPSMTEDPAIQDVILEQPQGRYLKPIAFYSMVDAMCSGRKLDYSTQERRTGWDVIQFDANRFSQDEDSELISAKDMSSSHEPFANTYMELVDGEWVYKKTAIGHTGTGPTNLVDTKLSDVLDSDFDPKHILSPRACRGMLRRAYKKEKLAKMPIVLLSALRDSADPPDDSKPQRGKKESAEDLAMMPEIYRIIDSRLSEETAEDDFSNNEKVITEYLKKHPEEMLEED